MHEKKEAQKFSSLLKMVENQIYHFFPQATVVCKSETPTKTRRFTNVPRSVYVRTTKRNKKKKEKQTQKKKKNV